MKNYKVTITFDVEENKGKDANSFLDELERVINDDIDSLIPVKDWPGVKRISNQNIEIREGGILHKRKR